MHSGRTFFFHRTLTELNPQYWSDRYEAEQTGWDLGEISPPLKAYFDQLENKDIKILIPGCGRAYEGIYLWENGFKNIHLADYSQLALDEVKKNCSSFPADQLHCVDFFELEGQFDLIVEQTMFCAIDPSFREKYIHKIPELLAPNGKHIGVLFNRDFEGGPPFGGSTKEYATLFSKNLELILMEDCHNSVEPRLGSEVFFIAQKKK